MKPLSERMHELADCYDDYAQGGGGWLHDFADEVRQLEELKTFHLSHGLALMVTEEAKLLCFNPRVKGHDRAAYEMWKAHTEERLRENIRLGLITPDIDNSN